jgi:hypothetical protein
MEKVETDITFVGINFIGISRSMKDNSKVGYVQDKIKIDKVDKSVTPIRG